MADPGRGDPGNSGLLTDTFIFDLLHCFNCLCEHIELDDKINQCSTERDDLKLTAAEPKQFNPE